MTQKYYKKAVTCMIGLNNYSKNTYYLSNLSNVWFAFVVHPKSNTTQQKETKHN